MLYTSTQSTNARTWNSDIKIVIVSPTAYNSSKFYNATKTKISAQFLWFSMTFENIFKMFKSSELSFFDYDEQHNHTLFTFLPISQTNGLPFPLYLNFLWKIIISSIQLCVLFVGIKLRVLILRYMLSTETRRPINSLIWIYQINGIFLGIGLIFKIILILSPVPLGHMIGESFCDWLTLPGCIYIVGVTLWSSFIAFFRIVYIKAQRWLKVHFLKVFMKNFIWPGRRLKYDYISIDIEIINYIQFNSNWVKIFWMG